jgi:hypothetical protein
VNSPFRARLAVDHARHVAVALMPSSNSTSAAFVPPDQEVSGRSVVGTYFRLRPLNELCRSRPSEVMLRYSTSAKKVGSTHLAFGFLIGFASLDFGLTTVSSCLLIWLETVHDQPVPTLPR